MIDAMKMAESYLKKVKIVDNNGREVIGGVDFYESEYDSGYGVPTIGIEGDEPFYRSDELRSLEILE